ncbi:N-acetylglucosamine kinase [Gemmobacter caeni]|uniref:N-acetylglucosamine kinase n=2 Tax=Gemmobacter TaxID=204456 RepID=A0A2T6B571_9RHOB|nr:MULTISPECIES: ROK family protein [Gemmobacter]PTX51183.1 N-acetylglucosamine kinase [Gemmobacter caeni]TWJ01183.1 N-acetylglucosamine kinase [Gemmobacter caeni]GHC17745.1 N-acetylglucosamine kinase [Gemmobacter nanjingensis]
MLAVFDIGGTKIRAAASSAPGRLGPAQDMRTPREDLAGFTATLAGAIASMGRGVQGIAISIAGCVDPVSGRMKVANIPCLDGRVPAEDLGAALGLPVWIGNDADCFALAEAAEGAGRGHRTVFGVILGTGVGGGLVIDGRLVTGAGGFAGEWGHGPVQDRMPLGHALPRFTCGCGQEGCLDAIGGARGIERLHRHLHGQALPAEAITTGWQAGDAASSETVAVWLEVMAGPLAMVLNVVGATSVPVGGGLARAPGLVAALDAAVSARRLWQATGPVVVPAALPGDPGLVGAAHAGWQELAPC